MIYQEKYEELIQHFSASLFISEDKFKLHYCINPDLRLIPDFIEEIEEKYSRKSDLYKREYIKAALIDVYLYLRNSARISFEKDVEVTEFLEDPDSWIFPDIFLLNPISDFKESLEIEALKEFRHACKIILFGPLFLELEEFIIDEIKIDECTPSLQKKFPNLFHRRDFFVLDEDFLMYQFTYEVIDIVLEQYQLLLGEILKVDYSSIDFISEKVSPKEIGNILPIYINQLIDSGVILKDGKTVSTNLERAIESLFHIIDKNLVSTKLIRETFLKQDGTQYTFKTVSEKLRSVRLSLQ